MIVNWENDFTGRAHPSSTRLEPTAQTAISHARRPCACPDHRTAPPPLPIVWPCPRFTLPCPCATVPTPLSSAIALDEGKISFLLLVHSLPLCSITCSRSTCCYRHRRAVPPVTSCCLMPSLLLHASTGSITKSRAGGRQEPKQTTSFASSIEGTSPSPAHSNERLVQPPPP
jgi:hypothetical protein